MNKLLKISIISAALISSLSAAGKDDPLNYKVTFDALQMKYDNNKDKTFEWDMNAWLGYDLNKIYIYSEGERTKSENESENQIVWSNAIAPYWDIQYGLGIDKTKENTKNWAVLAFSGMSSYFFEIRTAFLLDDNGNLGLRASAENEFLLTQKLRINVNSELSAYSKDDEKYEIQRGFSSLSLGANLKYEITKEFAPYIGLVYDKSFGDNTSSATSLVLGISLWF